MVMQGSFEIRSYTNGKKMAWFFKEAKAFSGFSNFQNPSPKKSLSVGHAESMQTQGRQMTPVRQIRTRKTATFLCSGDKDGESNYNTI